MISKKCVELSRIVSRYILITLVSIFGFSIFERLLTSPTIHALVGLLKIFYNEIILEGAYIYVNGQGFEITTTCVMGIIYWLLFILVFATAGLKVEKRFCVLAFAWLSVFIFNIMRMLFLVSIAQKPYFNGVHWLFENVIAIILVILVWTATIRLFKIKTVPFYSDLKVLKQELRNS